MVDEVLAVVALIISALKIGTLIVRPHADSMKRRWSSCVDVYMATMLVTELRLPGMFEVHAVVVLVVIGPSGCIRGAFLLWSMAPIASLSLSVFVMLELADHAHPSLQERSYCESTGRDIHAHIENSSRTDNASYRLGKSTVELVNVDQGISSYAQEMIADACCE
jgi:hypothetical protein